MTTRTVSSKGPESWPSVKNALPLLPLILLCGCVPQSVPVQEPGRTLAGNSRLPAQSIQHAFRDEHWDYLKNQSYDAYVIIDGPVDEDGHVSLRNIVSAYPDASRNEMAMRFAKNARITPLTVGTHVPAMAEVFVIFYETGHKPRFALIFSRQVETTTATSSRGTSKVYLETKYY